MLKQQAEHAERIRRNEERIAELGRANAQLRAEVLRMNARAGLTAGSAAPPAEDAASMATMLKEVEVGQQLAQFEKRGSQAEVL